MTRRDNQTEKELLRATINATNIPEPRDRILTLIVARFSTRLSRYTGPITGDGIVLHATDPKEGAANLAQTLATHKTLGDYDDHGGLGRDGLLDMPQKQHWHPKMMWYGPSGIGTTRGLQGFVDCHQLPFRIAFPNRKGGMQITDPGLGGHYIRIGDGKYSVTGGWPSVRAEHLGGGFLGTTPTGRVITMRVMDF